MRVYTLTLNPAYDVHASTEQFAAFHENLATITSREAGGKGVNISRALKNAGTRNTAVIVLGVENGEEFRQALTGMDCLYFEKPGRIRENLTLHCADGRETRISFAGFRVDESILPEVAKAIEGDAETIVTFTGRVASGMSMDAVKQFLLDLKKRGVKIVLDSKSFSLEDIYRIQPWLIKPNQEEISEYFSCNVETIAQAVEKAKQFGEKGIENVMISMGEQGALLLRGDEVYTAVPPKIQPVSTIGAGDSSIAGFISAFTAGKSPEDCLCSAVAFGTAACLTEGTQPPMWEDVERIRGQIQMTAK